MCALRLRRLYGCATGNGGSSSAPRPWVSKGSLPSCPSYNEHVRFGYIESRLRDCSSSCCCGLGCASACVLTMLARCLRCDRRITRLRARAMTISRLAVLRVRRAAILRSLIPSPVERSELVRADTLLDRHRMVAPLVCLVGMSMPVPRIRPRRNVVHAKCIPVSTPRRRPLFADRLVRCGRATVNVLPRRNRLAFLAEIKAARPMLVESASARSVGEILGTKTLGIGSILLVMSTMMMLGWCVSVRVRSSKSRCGLRARARPVRSLAILVTCSNSCLALNT